ncbi:hypothetical protein [Acinetobacter venetianus]|uniref:hypothetical protein n=1 Tax=Acinetobacter venetianus TaxID=52133 RepID=UPI003A90D9EC
MKHGVTYLSTSQYKKYKALKSGKSPSTSYVIISSVAKWLMTFVVVGFCLWILATLAIRGLDIEYNMQQAKIEKFMALNGDSYDNQK